MLRRLPAWLPGFHIELLPMAVEMKGSRYSEMAIEIAQATQPTPVDMVMTDWRVTLSYVCVVLCAAYTNLPREVSRGFGGPAGRARP